MRPASPAEHQLWLADQLRTRQTGTQDATYSTAEVLAVDDGLDPEVLTAALRILPARHPALRTCFTEHDGVLHVVTEPNLPAVVDRWTVSGDEEFDRLVADAIRVPFPLDRPPLWRAVVATHGPVTYLVLLLHHVIADGWSVDLLVRDLGAVYRGLADRTELPAPPSGSYAEYAGEQARLLAAGKLDGSVEHWRRTLAGAPGTSTVPGLGPSVERGGAQHFRPLPVGTHDRVRQLAAGLRATPYAVYLAAYALTLARRSRVRDLVIGMPSANRGEGDVLDVVGPFAAVLPIRLRLALTVTATDLVRQTTAAVFDAAEHERVPLARITERHRADSAGRPLFQTVAMERGWREPATTFAGRPARRRWTSTGTAKYDLLVTFPTETDDERIVIEYDLALYDERLAAAIAADVDQAIADLLGPGPITVLPDLTGSGSELVHERVAELARLAPWYPAVVAGRDWLGYADLDHRAGLAAAGLRQRGVRPGDLVGLRLPRGIDFVVALLAVVKAGAGYVPTDPSWPEARTRQVLEHTVLTVDDVAALVADEPLPPVPGHLDDPLCVLYTSGSTGGPKGVLIGHRTVRALTAPDQPFALRATDRTAHHANLAFDATTFEVWGTLLAGGTVLTGLPDDPGPTDYADQLRGCTAAFLPAGLFAELVRYPDCSAALRSLRLLIVGGNVLPPEAADRVANPDTVQLNGYGPTECTTFATMGPMAARTPWRTVPIGSPINGTQGYVLDEWLRPVPDGEVGELHLAGAGVAHGYLGDPRQTADRFRPDPFAPGRRMYATGDRVRRLPSGELDFVGRADAQLKYRGFRIEPAEIEAALLARPGVASAHVGLNAAGVLVAAVRGSADPAGLRDRLAAVLPEFMVPVHVAVVDRFPLTGNGKVDLPRLLSGIGADRAAGLGSAADDSAAPSAVADLWGAVLGVAVGDDTDFFASGGDSLKALRLLAECRSEFGVDLRPSDLFGHPTPRAFASLLTDRMRRSDA